MKMHALSEEERKRVIEGMEAAKENGESFEHYLHGLGLYPQAIYYWRKKYGYWLPRPAKRKREAKPWEDGNPMVLVRISG